MEYLKIYLPIYLLIYLLIAFVLPTYRTFKSIRINPITFGKQDNAHDYIGFLMKVLIVLLFIAILCFSFGLDQFLVPISYLKSEIFVYIGLIVIHLALVWICVAQFQMSTSWRIGIDEKHKTELKTQGIFGISRNPIFLGMILSVFGILFIIPNILTLLVAISTYFIIQIQVRLEEEFLEKQHGIVYLNYRKSVRRYI